MPVIEHIQTYPVIYPTSGHFRFLEDSAGRPTGRQTVVVRLLADNGEQGWGQCVPIPRWSYETLESVTSTIQTYLAPTLKGVEVEDEREIQRRMDTAIAPSFSTGQPICKAGIDLALWDLRGRLAGRHVRELWGQAGLPNLTLSWTLNPRSLAEVDALVQEGMERGYRHFNVKVAPDMDFDISLCKRVRELAPDSFLWADANGGYDEGTAERAVRGLADSGCDVLEQPLPANCLTGYQRLKKLNALPILLDEGVVSARDLEEFIALDMLDGVAMKPARCGGLTSARRQCRILRERGLILLGSGLTDPDISLAASSALFSAFGVSTPLALNGPQFLQGSILTEPVEAREGSLIVPDGPGLGVDVDEQALTKCARIDSDG